MSITLNRRNLLGGLLGAPLLGSLPGLAEARPAGAIGPAPAIASLKIGRVTVHAISDGLVPGEFTWFRGLPQSEITRRMSARPLAGGAAPRLNLTQWLVDDGERLVLIDAGAPMGALPGGGRLPAGLRALGLRREDIDIVAVTHGHFDHLGGLTENGRAAFPNAELLIHRADTAHFTDPAKRAAAPEFLHSSFDLTAAAVSAYQRLNRFDGERAITPYVSTADMRGHTPGHTAYRIADGGQSLLLVGDLLFDPGFHPARNDVNIVFEQDPQAAHAMRRRFFPRLAEERALVAATHMPFPGIGRIEKEGQGLRWAAADFPQLG